DPGERVLRGDSGDELVGRGVRIQLTGGDPLGETVERIATAEITHAIAEYADGERLDLVSRACPSPAVTFAAGLRPGRVLLQRVDDLVGALPLRGDRLHDRRLPPLGVALSQRKHVAQVADGLVSALAVSLVDHEDVGDLEDARLGG